MLEAGLWYELEPLQSIMDDARLKTANSAVHFYARKFLWYQNGFYVHHVYRCCCAGGSTDDVVYRKVCNNSLNIYQFSSCIEFVKDQQSKTLMDLEIICIRLNQY